MYILFSYESYKSQLRIYDFIEFVSFGSKGLLIAFGDMLIRLKPWTKTLYYINTLPYFF